MYYGIFIVAILSGWMLPTTACSQTGHNYLFKTLTFREGLSNSHVTSMAQDDLGYIWLGTENGLNQYDGTKIVVFKHIFDDTTSLPDDHIRKIFLDSQQRMWLVTASAVCQYQPTSRTFKTYPIYTGAESEEALPLDIIESAEGQILVLSQYNVLSVFSEQYDRFDKQISIHSKIDIHSLCLYHGRLFAGGHRFLLEVDPLTGGVMGSYELYNQSHPLSSGITQLMVMHDQLWIAGIMMNLYQFDPAAQTLKRITALPYTTSVAALDDQTILAGSYEGAFLYHTNTEQVLPLRSVDYDSFLYNVSQVFVDKDHQIWAASPQQGIIHTAGQRVFRDVRHLNEDLASYANNISSLRVMSNQQLWIGLNTGQIITVDLENHAFELLYPDSVPALLPGKGTVFSILEDSQQRIWVGSYEGGLRHYEPFSDRFAVSNAIVDSLGIRSNDIRSIVEDTRGQLWLAVHGRGVDVYDPAQKKVVASHGLSVGDADPYISDWTFQLAIAPDSTVWIASVSGLQMVKGTTKKYFQHHAEQPGSLSDDRVTSLLLDTRGNLWIGTALGLNVLNPRDSSFIKFTTQQGLSDNYVSSLIEDTAGNLWLGTHDGLSRLTYDTHPEKATIRSVELPPGLYSNQFIDRASTMDTAGNLYIATTHGLLIFNPQDIPLLRSNLSVFFTNVKVFKSTEDSSDDTPATTYRDYSVVDDLSQIRLQPDENTVSIGFSAVDFAHTNPIRYHYRLRGYDNRWLTSTDREVTYYSLPAGEYQFEVKATATNTSYLAPVKSLSILVEEPWYRTAGGQVALLLALLALTILGFYLLLERIRLKNQAQLNEKEREMDQLKIKFFMNISHEFRTPLSLILGPMKKLTDLVDDHEAQQYLQLMQRNTQRLLRLVNQLLDLRQLDGQRYQLRVAEGELVAFVREVYLSFQYLAQQHRIDYQFHNHTPQLSATWFDTDVLDKILYNLLANAFKYTPDGGQIQVAVSHHPTQAGWIVVEVSDTGVGLEASHLNKIFDRFYRVEATAHQGGTGIGLSLCQELIHLHRGKITVTSTPRRGSTFTVAIPIRAEDYGAAVVTSSEPRKEVSPYVDDVIASLVDNKVEQAGLTLVENKCVGQKPLVLIVDDNVDLLQFIKESIATDFAVITAQDGQQAFQQAVATVPDAVVSDVMMPVMNGLQLAKKLKEDLRTSHIPVVLLTARASEQYQVEGLQLGVDDYIAKPFSLEVLTAKLHSLVDNRVKLRELFTNVDRSGVRRQVNESTEKPFLLQLTEVIEENMDNAALTTDDICRAVGMSRSQLYRKLSAVTGQSVHEFVKLYRLTKAAELLSTSDRTVTQIAQLTGFKHVQTFTRSFKEHYGCAPSQYIPGEVQA